MEPQEGKGAPERGTGQERGGQERGGAPQPALGPRDPQSADARAHEGLHELALEQQERDQQGADVISVAAVMIDQSMPWSVDENTCRPTVSGRDSTELVMISGHRKLFQW